MIVYYSSSYALNIKIRSLCSRFCILTFEWWTLIKLIESICFSEFLNNLISLSFFLLLTELRGFEVLTFDLSLISTLFVLIIFQVFFFEPILLSRDCFLSILMVVSIPRSWDLFSISFQYITILITFCSRICRCFESISTSNSESQSSHSSNSTLCSDRESSEEDSDSSSLLCFLIFFLILLKTSFRVRIGLPIKPECFSAFIAGVINELELKIFESFLVTLSCIWLSLAFILLFRMTWAHFINFYSWICFWYSWWFIIPLFLAIFFITFWNLNDLNFSILEWKEEEPFKCWRGLFALVFKRWIPIYITVSSKIMRFGITFLFNFDAVFVSRFWVIIITVTWKRWICIFILALLFKCI